MNIRRKLIRSVVEQILCEHKQIEPPVDVRQIAENLGAILKSGPIEDDLSGFLYKEAATGKVVIGVNRSHSRTRQKFTIAHELGHLLLHTFESDLHYDDGGYGHGYGRIRLRNRLSSQGEDRDEVEANFFAAELLMPVSMLERELDRDLHLDMLDEKSFEAAIRLIAQKFGVSSQALTIRLVRLGLIHVPL